MYLKLVYLIGTYINKYQPHECLGWIHFYYLQKLRINSYDFDLFKCRSKNVRLHKIRLLYLLLLHMLFKMVKLGTYLLTHKTIS